MTCLDVNGNLPSVCNQTLADAHASKVITQYRESTNMLTLLNEAIFDQIEPMKVDLCNNLQWTHIDIAEGDHLDFYGNLVGLPRCNCDSKNRKFFSFSNAACPPLGPCACVDTVGGFCDDFYCGQDSSGYGEYCFTDDVLYRRYIKAKGCANRSDTSIESMLTCASLLFDTPVHLHDSGNGVLTIGLNRLITTDELELLPMIERILPTYPGTRLQFASSDGSPFGFGTGWGDFCTSNFVKICNKVDISDNEVATFGFCIDADTNDPYLLLTDGWSVSEDGGFCQASFSCKT